MCKPLSQAEEFIANPRKSPVLTALYHSDGLNTDLCTPCSPNKNNPTQAVIASISVSNGYLRYALLKPYKYCPSSASQCGLVALTWSVPLSICLVLCLPAYSFPLDPICFSSTDFFIYMELAHDCGLPVAMWEEFQIGNQFYCSLKKCSGLSPIPSAAFCCCLGVIGLHTLLSHVLNCPMTGLGEVHPHSLSEHSEYLQSQVPCPTVGHFLDNSLSVGGRGVCTVSVCVCACLSTCLPVSSNFEGGFCCLNVCFLNTFNHIFLIFKSLIYLSIFLFIHFFKKQFGVSQLSESIENR